MDSAPTKHDFRLFRFTREEVRVEFPDSCFQDVINTDAFRRLESIHFLGSIDFLLSGSRYGVEERHTRYQHSLAVAALAKRFGLLRGASRKDLKNLVVASLLHDIGHAPLSHSLEPAFKGLYHLDHHLVGEKILKGEVKIGVRLAKALNRCGINNFELMSTISGLGEGVAKDLFARSINVDTIEGILRSASYIYRKGVTQDPEVVIEAFAALGPSSLDVLDEFWFTKGKVYAELIQAPKGLMADYICKKYMERNAHNFESGFYYGTEKELRRIHAVLFDALDNFGRHNIIPEFIADGEEFAYTRRDFYIDPSVMLNSYVDVDRRYRQRKFKGIKRIKKTGGEDAHSLGKHPRSESLF